MSDTKKPLKCPDCGNELWDNVRGVGFCWKCEGCKIGKSPPPEPPAKCLGCDWGHFSRPCELCPDPNAFYGFSKPVREEAKSENQP